MVFTSVDGFPGKRYHAGVANIDQIENCAIDRAKPVFGAGHADVQPHSGTQANQAVYCALLKPEDTVLSMELSSGEQLSHGLHSYISGCRFKIITYRTDDKGVINYQNLQELALQHRPKLMIVGGSSCPRAIEPDAEVERLSILARLVRVLTRRVLAEDYITVARCSGVS